MDGDGKVSLQDIRDAVVQIYKVSSCEKLLFEVTQPNQPLTYSQVYDSRDTSL